MIKKRIVCFGDSNTWGFDARSGGRFAENIRWPSLLQGLLGEETAIIEEGLPGRTSVMDDPLCEGLNGITYLGPCLLSHQPLDLVVVMLGTNDTKERFHLTSHNIAQGMTRLAMKAKHMPVGRDGGFPEVLVISPPHIDRAYTSTSIFPAMGEYCAEKSAAIYDSLTELLSGSDIHLLDAATSIRMNTIDYMHLDQEGHKSLAGLVFQTIKKILL
jgi:lysophospholipase L1-like esterase